ncbi:hypothetical protein SDC9_145071 [bioreactor metagenome]|uniref:Uncharacterized protein n=1 Tax=bioreactor metagenome TaxID=1076179 RepID=A0A645E8Y3_9ZZZZ
MLRAIDLGSIGRAEDERQHKIEHEEDQHIDQHQLDLPKLNLRYREKHQREHHDDRDCANIIGKHHRCREQKKAQELRHTGKIEDDIVPLDIVKEFRFHRAVLLS